MSANVGEFVCLSLKLATLFHGVLLITVRIAEVSHLAELLFGAARRTSSEPHVDRRTDQPNGRPAFAEVDPL